jgi:hypothetical protein
MSLLTPADRRRHTSHVSNQGLVVRPQLKCTFFYLGKKVFNGLVSCQQLPVEGGVVRLRRLQPVRKKPKWLPMAIYLLL